MGCGSSTKGKGDASTKSAEKELTNNTSAGEEFTKNAGSISNVALGKVAHQSSVFERHGPNMEGRADASRAVNGHTETPNDRSEWGMVAHTIPNADAQPWWSVDLGSDHVIVRVKVFNRYQPVGGGPARLPPAKIFLLADCDVKSFPISESAKTILRSFTISAVQAEYEWILTPPQTGVRHVLLQKDGRGILNIREVQVFGRGCEAITQQVVAQDKNVTGEQSSEKELTNNTSAGKEFAKNASGELEISNVALGKVAHQSSVFERHGPNMEGRADASRAVNGHTETPNDRSEWGMVAHTIPNADAQPWWSVDLGSDHVIVRVKVFNRHQPVGGGPARLPPAKIFLLADVDVSSYPISESAKPILNSFTISAAQAEYEWTLIAPQTGVRHVLLQKDGRGILNIREVQVFGYKQEALGANNSMVMESVPSEELRAPTNMYIAVKSLSGSTLNVGVCSEQTVKIAKARIRQQDNFLSNRVFQLVLKGQILEDSTTLSDAGVEKGALLFVVLRGSADEEPAETPKPSPSLVANHADSEAVKKIEGCQGMVIDHGDSGPWVKILEYGTEPYKPTASAVGTLSTGKRPTAYAKLSDAHINDLAGNDYYLRLISSNQDAFFYAHIRGFRFADDQYGFGYHDRSIGSKIKKSFAEGDFKYSKLRACHGIDTLGVVSDDGPDRWWCDVGGEFCSGWGGAHKRGVRTFSQGATTKYAMRQHVSIWVKSETVTAALKS